LLLDEPVNGLDPEGVLWIRNLLKSLAAEGRTVLVSSHLMSEMAVTAEHLIVVGQGRLIADTTVADLTQKASGDVVDVRSADDRRLRELLLADGVTVADADDGGLRVTGMTSAAVGLIAAEVGIPLVQLVPHQASLEEAFMQITRESVEFVGAVR
jgi:ABC-2 type transport system ATP-binding protein